MDDFFRRLFDGDNKEDQPEHKKKKRKPGSEPSFDFHDFKEWLSKQTDDVETDDLRESVERTRKEKLRKKFYRKSSGMDQEGSTDQ